MNLNSNNINGNLPPVPVNLEDNPANPPVQPIQAVPANPFIPVEVPAGGVPVEPTLLQEISTEPFTLEKAIKVLEELRNLDSMFIIVSFPGSTFPDVLKSIKYVIDNYSVDIFDNEDFLNKVRELLRPGEHGTPANFPLLDTDVLLLFFKKVSLFGIMDEQAWKNYFKDAFLDLIDSLLNQKNNEFIPEMQRFYFDAAKLFLILFGENKDYCEGVFEEIYNDNKDNDNFKKLFCKLEKTEEEFKSYLQEELFGSQTLFYPYTPGCTNAKSYYEFLDEKSKGLHHPFLCHRPRNVKSARNVAPQMNEADKLETFLATQTLDENVYRLIRLLASLRSENGDMEDIKRQIKERFKELFGQNKVIGTEVIAINKTFSDLYNSTLFNEQDVWDGIEDLRIPDNGSSND